MLQPEKNPILFPQAKRAKDSKESKEFGELKKEKRLKRAAKRRTCNALLKAESAAALIREIPATDESLHFICNGNFGLWDVIPAILKLTKRRIRRADISTLSLSCSNIQSIDEFLTSGKIKYLHLIYSVYFAKTSTIETNKLKAAIEGKNARIAALRTHAKILALELDDRTCLTVETSANLRSCSNLEQYTITNSKPLMNFHRDWISDAIEEFEDSPQK